MLNKLFSASTLEKGQGLVEYALILVLVSIVVIGSLMVLGPKICNTFNTINTSLPGGTSNAGGNCGGGASSGMGLAFTSAYTGCSGTCTNTTFTCSPGTSYTIQYTASSYGGATGSSPNHSCSGGGTAFAGNFWQAQQVTIVNQTTGQTQSYTVPPP